MRYCDGWDISQVLAAGFAAFDRVPLAGQPAVAKPSDRLMAANVSWASVADRPHSLLSRHRWMVMPA